jgi:hypothetical protein
MSEIRIAWQKREKDRQNGIKITHSKKEGNKKTITDSLKMCMNISITVCGVDTLLTKYHPHCYEMK